MVSGGNTWRKLVTDNAYEALVFIDDKPLQDYGIDVLLTSSEPIAPSLRNDTLTIPSMHGAYDMGAELGARVITLDCVFPRQSYTDLKRQIREFNRLLFDEYGRPKTFKLRAGDEVDKYYNVRLSRGIDVRRIAGRGHATLELTAFDPFAYANVTSDEIVWGSEVVTFEYNYLLGHEGTGGGVSVSGPTDVDIYVDGYAVRPIIEISGSATSMTITSGKYRLTFPSFSNANWTIDCEKYTVTKDGKNEFDLVDLREFYLLPGDNTVAISGTGIDIEMTIKYRDKFV